MCTCIYFLNVKLFDTMTETTATRGRDTVGDAVKSPNLLPFNNVCKRWLYCHPFFYHHMLLTSHMHQQHTPTRFVLEDSSSCVSSECMISASFRRTGDNSCTFCSSQAFLITTVRKECINLGLPWQGRT